MTVLRVFPRPHQQAVRAFSMILCSLLCVGTLAADEAIFTGTSVAPWRLYLGSSSNLFLWIWIVTHSHTCLFHQNHANTQSVT